MTTEEDAAILEWIGNATSSPTSRLKADIIAIVSEWATSHLVTQGR